MKKLALFAAAVVIAAAVFFWNITRSQVATTETTHTRSVAVWASSAVGVNEVIKEANLVVRARVISEPAPRVIRSDLPMIEFHNGAPVEVGTRTQEAVFSDTRFEVIKAYVGQAPTEITVMQTGGPQPDNPSNIEEFSDDPLYKVGEEYILFLVDISGDAVQAPDRALYRIVNPSGRYAIRGDTVMSYSDISDQRKQANNVPTSLEKLEAQIARSVP